ERDPLAQELCRFPPLPNVHSRLAQALLANGPVISTDASDELLQEVSPDARYLEIIRALGVGTYMLVPLHGRGGVVGAICFVSLQSGRQYTRDDIALAEELARRAALAIDNARLYREAEEANRLKEEFLATVSH